MLKVCVTLTGSDCLYAHGFRFYFTPLNVLFAFPHGTGSLSVGRKFSLKWSPNLLVFHVLRPTPISLRSFRVRVSPYRGLSRMFYYSAR